MAFVDERQAVAYFMGRLYQTGLTTSSGGNISLRLPDDRVAITPAGIDKGRVSADEVAVIGLDGVNLTPRLRASSETQMHLEIMKARGDINAIVHAHPVTASAFSAARTPINCRLLAETYSIVGTPVMAPYARTGTIALARLVAEAMTHADCVLMQNHGVVCVGKTLLQAFDRLELMESAARMTLAARQLDGVRSLTDEQCRELDELMGRTGP